MVGCYYDKGCIKEEYWKNIKIKVDKTIKRLSDLLSLLDKTIYS
ncbi:hypothetical protein GCM10017717_12110 [Deinococcus persicinus]